MFQDRVSVLLQKHSSNELLFNAALTFDDEDSILYSVVKIIRCEALEDDEYSYGCEFVGMAPVLGYIFDKLEAK